MSNQIHIPGFPGRRQQGFTIVEIVIAFIIIGILTLVMVPVLSRQTADARVNACEQDLEHLANAEERACVDTGYLYRPYVLNDVIYGDGIPNSFKQLQAPGTGQENRVNGIRDNGSAFTTPQPLYQNASDIFISPATQSYLVSQATLFTRLTGSQTGDLSANLNAETNFRWNGPYINWRRDANQNDWPDDPWGHDYLLFTKNGVLYPPIPEPIGTSPSTGGGGSGMPGTQDPYTDYTFQFSQEVEFDVGGGQTYAFPAVDKTTGQPIFDRPTWLSLGPDGLPGNGSINPTDPNFGFGRGDDIFRMF